MNLETLNKMHFDNFTFIEESLIPKDIDNNRETMKAAIKEDIEIIEILHIPNPGEEMIK